MNKQQHKAIDTKASTKVGNVGHTDSIKPIEESKSMNDLNI